MMKPEELDDFLANSDSFKVASVQRFRCHDCGGWLQARKAENNKDIKYLN